MVKKILLWIAWKIDHACHCAIEWFDPVTEDFSREMFGGIRDAFNAARSIPESRRYCRAGSSERCAKWLVEAWEHRKVPFIVEAENAYEAKKVAEDVYANDEELQEDLVNFDDSIVGDEIRVIMQVD